MQCVNEEFQRPDIGQITGHGLKADKKIETRKLLRTSKLTRVQTWAFVCGRTKREHNLKHSNCQFSVIKSHAMHGDRS